ncbi:MAG TPA: glycosyltransferase family 2 protein [Membranihabitans sp.]|nr:glycosyltransferase family 2 protein [Membranihabitans sp.]
MKITVSVIVTTYNSEKTIDRTLRSILNQQGIGTEFDIELIVADDCSNDGTVEKIRQYEAKFISTEKNSGGPNKGRNLGLAISTGDFICIVDHDDEWMPHKIITQLTYLKKVPIVTCGYTLCDTNENKKSDQVTRSDSQYIYFEKNHTFLTRLSRDFKEQTAYESGAIYWGGSRNILYEEYSGIVDYDRQLKLYHNRDSIEVSEPLFYRYENNKNLSKSAECWYNDSYISLMAIGQYAARYPKEARHGIRNIFGKLGRYYYLYKDNMTVARFFFWKSDLLDWKTIAFILTSFWGSDYVKKRLNKNTGYQARKNDE